MPHKASSPPSRKNDLEALCLQVQLAPDSFQSERVQRLGVTQPTISRTLSKLGMTRKKTTRYTEPDAQQKQAFQTALSNVTGHTLLILPG